MAAEYWCGDGLLAYNRGTQVSTIIRLNGANCNIHLKNIKNWTEFWAVFLGYLF